MSADRELRALYDASDMEFENLHTPPGYSPPYNNLNIPYLFFFLDTEREYETGLEYIYPEKYLKYTGSDFSSMLIPQPEVAHIL